MQTISRQPHFGRALRDYTPNIQQLKNMTIEESTLIGILFTDGCLSRKNKSSWRFYLGNTSFEIIQTFSKCITKIFGADSSNIKISQKISNGRPYYMAFIDNAYYGDIFTKKYGTFRTLAYKNKTGGKTYPQTELPLFSDKTNIYYFLQAAFSCDGGVNLYKGKAKRNYSFLIRNIYLACSHPQLQIDYFNLLKKVGIQSKIITKDNRILIRGKTEIQKFQKKIGFLKGTKITQHSSFWQGYEKNEVLNLLVSSYEKPNTILNLPQFLDNEIVRAHGRP